ncbi:glycerophosphodiester phosphodiesterase [Actinoallomurus bryophytorum]|uniref:glycerophosphodiester phosphodiesterase n=1 Tax=Actinoallomurus bryophytorum TaxID=1490222 RepID=A0A543CLH8_9ACTN|nr:glycerophosphodiester phosphodiesterase [Actinoallomurus bryophytorum]TQL97757.1 glycerophosphoryl diester phosphodiesterase [Actinoallomurus bryophytorum]
MSLSRRLLAGGLALVTAGTAYAAFASSSGAASAPAAPQARQGARLPIVIAHRGASEYRPEESKSAYELAIEMGADYIEPDIVTTKDHVLVARHDNWLNDTTDVANHPEFASLKKTKTIDGVAHTDWFTEDFTYAQLRTLRLKERLPDLRQGSSAFDGTDPVASLDEVLQIAKDHHVGVYPETKHPTYFRSIGLPLEDELLKDLAQYGFKGRNDKVFIQSFETSNLRALHKRTSIKLIQLIDTQGAPYDFVANHDPRTYSDLVTPAGLKGIAQYAYGIGPGLTRIIPVDASSHALPPTTLVADAHHAGLAVHPWTVRPENSFLPVEYQEGNPGSPSFPKAEGDASRLLADFYKLGVDGIFSDDSALAVSTRHRVFG